MFPIIDVRGHVIGFGGRVMDDSTPKYLNSPETLIFNKRKNLFAMNLAEKIQVRADHTGGRVYGRGGPAPVWLLTMLWPPLGTALTEDTPLLAKYTDQVVLIYDGDQAGQSATGGPSPFWRKPDCRSGCSGCRGRKDPDEFLHKFGLSGSSSFWRGRKIRWNTGSRAYGSGMT